MITVGDTVELRYIWRIEAYDPINLCFKITVLKENGVAWEQLLVVPIFLSRFEIYPAYQQWMEPLDYLELRAPNVIPIDFVHERFQVGTQFYTLSVNKFDFRKRGLFYLRNEKKLGEKEDISTFLTYCSLLKSEEAAEESIADQIHDFLISKDKEKNEPKYYIDKRINREGGYIYGKVVALLSSELDEMEQTYVQYYHSVSPTNEVTAIIQDPITNYQFFCPVGYLIKKEK